MPFAFRRIALSGLLVAAGLAVTLFPAASQGLIEFGSPAGEDTLLGGNASYGPPSVSSSEWGRAGHRSFRRDRDGREDYRYHVPGRVWNEYRPISRSMIHASRVREPAFYRGTGIFANAVGGSVVVYGAASAPIFVTRDAPGPKIIDVEAERLDRQPIGASGVSVEQRGTTKIIRLASGYGDMAMPNGRSHAERALTEAGPVFYPDPDAEPAAAPGAAREHAAVPAASGEEFEPWTDAWMQHCVERYETFDASLGTFTDDTGRRHFCIAGTQ
ncbi:BA14K family protein [Aureimonas mangrovi]|uniref:BA14K family protein n=1 Tax=Aureimonas mangrovi TaxID=2758041 RepID=UPI00163D8C9A|nr:BA14K family protein [Aureimonas mangrovi]